ncbi:MAG: hypothetical protein IJY46_07750 [Lentisphaeria bacterium]|nr:hypothetical protein [Lentisphaeria bacterium]
MSFKIGKSGIGFAPGSLPDLPVFLCGILSSGHSRYRFHLRRRISDRNIADRTPEPGLLPRLLILKCCRHPVKVIERIENFSTVSFTAELLKIVISIVEHTGLKTEVIGGHSEPSAVSGGFLRSHIAMELFKFSAKSCTVLPCFGKGIGILGESFLQNIVLLFCCQRPELPARSIVCGFHYLSPAFGLLDFLGALS